MPNIYVFDSFLLTQRGIVVVVQHDENGLAEGRRLQSEVGEIWEIHRRVLFAHAMEIHILFENERWEECLLSFKSLEQRNISLQKIKEQEKDNIFQYILKPIGHKGKPIKGVFLEIVA